MISSNLAPHDKFNNSNDIGLVSNVQASLESLTFLWDFGFLKRFQERTKTNEKDEKTVKENKTSFSPLF